MVIILILILLIIPLIFQIKVGNLAAYRWISLKLWVVCLISFFSEFLMIVLSGYLTMRMLENKGIRDGLPIVGTVMIGVFIGMIMVIIMGFQLYTMLKDKHNE
jgi:hypothetical protein